MGHLGIHVLMDLTDLDAESSYHMIQYDILMYCVIYMTCIIFYHMKQYKSLKLHHMIYQIIQ